MLDIYAFATPNSVKVPIALEELGLPYVLHAINVRQGEQKAPAFLALNPNAKVPVIVDSDGELGPMTLTESAAERVRAVMAKGDKAYVGLRVGVKNGGCAGQEYVMEYAEAANPLDEVVEDKGVTILVEPKAVLFLLGTEIDYEVTRLASKFVFRNPNQTDACGCGESVTIVPAAGA